MNAPLRRSRPYIFWGQTQSLCETCLTLVPAKIEIVGNEVWYEKRCRQHGGQSTLLSSDAAYWRRATPPTGACARTTSSRATSR
jgi:uncharacterized radical SAM superfamily Fe-S cluster-containing enzyme